MFIDNLISKIKEINSPCVLGIDPSIEKLPDFIKQKFYKEYGQTVIGATQAILYFNKKLIDALYDIIPAVKLQSAYFELYGIEGIKIFKETIDYAKEKGLLIIGDVKRNDIGSTATAYSSAYIGQTILDNNQNINVFNCDAATINPYLGSDGVLPFIKDCEKYQKGIFILVKTSNKSSGEFQDLIVGQNHLYEIVANSVSKWGESVVGKSGYSSVGAVVGATYPEQAKVLRKIMPNNYFLVPGFGAQGASAKDIADCFNSDGLGAVIVSARGIMYAYKSDKWKDEFSEAEFDLAAREETLRMRSEINSVI